MTYLRTEDLVIVHFFLLLFVVGCLAVVLFYYEVYKTSENIASKIPNSDKLLDRSNIGLLIEYGDRSTADQLSKNVRVLCWVMLQPGYEKRLWYIKTTWGKRCNIILFMSTAEHKALKTITLPVSEGKDNQWAKTKAAYTYVYENHRDDADWFMKADDDTYVVVENLRYMLADYNSNLPIYFGCRFNHKKMGYMSGGAGYVLSRAALDKLVDEGLSGPTHCKVDDGEHEYLKMGTCVAKIGVVAGATRDMLRRGQFFPFHVFPEWDEKYWYWHYVYYPPKDGQNCCYEYAITFHYVQPNDMYVLDYLIYQLRPYGIEHKAAKEPRILNKVSKKAFRYDAKDKWDEK